MGGSVGRPRDPPGGGRGPTGPGTDGAGDRPGVSLAREDVAPAGPAVVHEAHASWGRAPGARGRARRGTSTTIASMNLDLSLERRAAVHRALGEPHRLTIVDALRLSDRSPSELCVRTGLGTNLVAFHLGVLEEAEVVERSPSEGDARRRYVRLHRDVLMALTPQPTLVANDVVFVCTANSARSQLAAALWRRRTGLGARSAGSEPARRVHPLAIATAAEHGLDLSTTVPRGYDDLATPPDLVVSVCDRAREGGLPFDVPALHWSVPDPVVGDRTAFDAAFRELTGRIDVLAASRRDAA
jgi:ArsR family transcriptional regulator, arsenate/arsenite/antimonite-responsive transcriptional repressor / arsenate reductase (thioredoxin)